MQIESLERPFLLRGALRASDLVRELGVAQPTISRALGMLGNRLVRMGRGRSTRYALRRTVGREGTRWPLYEIGAAGEGRLAGHLESLAARQWHFEAREDWPDIAGGMFENGLYPDWPWFLDDLRPQGFLGRLFARRCALEEGFPADPRSWTADDVLTATLRHGTDLPGSFVVGEAAMERILARRLEDGGALSPDDLEHEYPRLAEAVLGQEWPGSAAAGEQPKFTALVGEAGDDARHVIVKFSGTGANAGDGRWADLLACEHIASKILRDHGHAAAETELRRFAGRTFLESTRFDRSGRHGRRGLVSLAALDAAWFGEAHTPWTDAAERLRREGWLTAGDAFELSVRWWFGRLIGNTDMHYGNVALFTARGRPFSLAPVYDMLPMGYRPGPEGRTASEPLAAVLPTPGGAEFYAAAAGPAARFWQAVEADPHISADFRSLAGRNAAVIERCRAEADV